MKTTKTVFVLLVVTVSLAVQVHAQTFLTNGLVAYYPFNGNANDASGNGHNATVNSNTVLIADRFGITNAAYHFQGALMQFTNIPVNLAGPCSFGLWMRLNGYDEGHVIAELNTTDFQCNGNPLIWQGDAGVWWTRCGGVGSGTNSLFDLASGLMNTWHHLFVSVSGGATTTYLDGQVTTNTLQSFPSTTLANLTVGDAGNLSRGNQYSRVDLDDVRMYNRALSASEVQQLFVYESQTHVAGAFQLVYGQYSWPEAKSDAESRGGHLATFGSQSEWNLAQPLISQFNSPIVQDLWIGGYQPVGSPEPSGNWSWITGEPWTFSLWWPGEPNNQGGNEDSVIVGFGGAGWLDGTSQSKISYILELGPLVNLIKAVKPSFSNLTLTKNYQLQVSGDLNTWTNQGAVFTATNTSMVYPQYWDVENWDDLYFRLQVGP